VPFHFSQAQKEPTTGYAKDVEGVKEVENEMSVAKASEKPAETVGESLDDASITAQVKMSLLAHRMTSVLNIKVTTTDGIVSIGGKVSNGAAKDLVNKLVTDINGVKSVINNMIIEDASAMNN
jgi:hyperosmotically inducible periplasmic protein